ncbi:hypothetical protein BBBOND_0300440 [Babesia bigemina]|uniref:Uncharacterized protein n=1 Tax=Babesia bigemina TaxID=5866 RepID=A0A061DB48_BABBI|nr:hypothetical protein BBBOND_0300440 [Babesia bigemina]CDR96139.1 hypothetical protein BBBOND_0300440 [Babesia bigemina]|eukprot:XP_012768325.1 hypothetical protein BBBOND_0300440 [Babesia bigemina]
MVHHSLTEVPRSFKEAVDWLMALRDIDGEKSLRAIGDAVYKFLANKPVGKMEVPALEEVKRISQQFLEEPELKENSYVKELLNRYKTPMNKTDNMWWKSFRAFNGSNYSNFIKTGGLNAEKIARNVDHVTYGCAFLLDNIKRHDQYKSAYTPEATWETSCTKDPEACAVILVGIAPMLYVGLNALWDAMNGVIWHSNDNTRERLVDVLKALGYVEPECQIRNTPYVFRGLRHVDRDMLEKLYDLSGFWAFY